MNQHLSEEEKRSLLSKLRAENPEHRAIKASSYQMELGGDIPFSALSDDAKLAWCRKHIPDEVDAVDALLKMPDGPERRRAFKELNRRLHRERLRRLREQAAGAENRRRVLEAKQMAGELMEWIKQPFQLRRPEGTMFPALRHAFVNDRCRTPAVEHHCSGPDADDFEATWESAISFVIEHDWAGAFKGATDFDAGSFQLPATQCLFEFNVGGRPTIVLAIQDQQIYDGRLVLLTAFRMREGWFMNGAILFDPDGSMKVSGSMEGDTLQPMEEVEGFGYERFLELMRYLAGQVRAAAIALDAEVATTEAKREPHRRNVPPEKRAKKPDYSYHVVSLARRSRADLLPRDPSAEPGTRRRLHFRRGHWRRYADHRTWINWMLVGDPDLGFVDKHYKM